MWKRKFAIIAAWRDDYNAVRPHSALGYLTPERFAQMPVPTAGLSFLTGPTSGGRSVG